MKPEDIKKAYNQITHIWDNEKVDMNNGIVQHKKAISFVKNRGNALEIGCGCTGRFIDFLAEEGFKPSGIDISDEMLNIARKKHPNIQFMQGADGSPHNFPSPALCVSL
ncbi:class I SAM-dependent methyltransferase [Vibrio pectenicida]|uniref:Class I SAM-dependent methyltransferase n=1 Tax=Vibrio pectenicida TaxID=62763 RepID=A0A7Y4EFN8_9VIBR|nr:class I SAM-dependent methyltransferase [Vibrio pectenicida]NOH72772.1 class I SAM-dependent methyltransferase [Vibrio pectenicida]